MNINKIDNTNFKAIYRLPYSKQALNEVKQQILPQWVKVANQKSAYFVGRNPSFDGLKMWIEAIAKKNNSSVEWLKMNAKNHGAEVEYIEEGFIYVMNSEKDIEAINNYISERAHSTIEQVKQLHKQKTSVLHKIKRLFIEEEKPDLGYNENTPDHLKLLFQLIKQNKDETKIFNDAFPKIIEVKSTKELFTKMLNER